MDANAKVLKRTFALVADRKEKTVLLLDVEARVRKIPAKVIISSSESVVFQTERRFINNKEQIDLEADSLITLHEADPEDEDPLHSDDLYYDDISSIDSGSTEPNPDLPLNFASDEKAVSPLPPGLPNNECSGEAEQMYAPPILLRSEEEYQQNRKDLIKQYNHDSRELYRRFYAQAQQLKQARKRIYSS
jgi:hypothetical protein